MAEVLKQMPGVVGVEPVTYAADRQSTVALVDGRWVRTIGGSLRAGCTIYRERTSPAPDRSSRDGPGLVPANHER